MTLILQWLGIAFIVAGAALTLVTGIGMVTLTGLFSRMHAATKPQVLSLGLLCVGVSLVLQDLRVAATLALIMAMQLIAAPISAHMLSRAAYRAGRVDKSRIHVNEYDEDVVRARDKMAD